MAKFKRLLNLLASFIASKGWLYHLLWHRDTNSQSSIHHWFVVLIAEAHCMQIWRSHAAYGDWLVWENHAGSLMLLPWEVFLCNLFVSMHQNRRVTFYCFCVEGVIDSTLVQASAFWDASVWACVEHQIEKLQNKELCWFNLEDWFVWGWLQGNVVLSTQPEWKFHYSLANCFLEQQVHIS
jgi:hypothetical protein